MPFKTNLTDLRPSKEKFSKKITLLSRGYYNQSAFPDGEITVFPWDSSVDDWILNKMRKGGLKGRTLIYNVLPKVCDLNGCVAGSFLSGEVLLILFVAQSILRDGAIQTKGSCPNCGHEHEETIKIPDQLERLGEKSVDYAGSDLVHLPKANDDVRIRPSTVDDEMAVIERAKDKTEANPISNRDAQVMQSIVSINDGRPDGVKDLTVWFRALPLSDVEVLLQKFDEIQPRLSLSLTIQCDECSTAYEHDLTITDEFFRRTSAASGRR